MADVLAVGAHPDDVELACGGTVAACVAHGHSVVIADLTRGEQGTRGTPEERAGEAAAAAAVLRVERVQLDLGDTRLDPGDRRQREAVIGLLRHHRPTLVLAPPLEDAHPDHVAAGRLVKEAAYLAGVQRVAPSLPRHRPVLVLHYLAHEVKDPSVLVDVSAHHAVKLEAVRCHASQLFDPERQEPETLLSRPTFLGAIVARDRFFGSLAGTLYAEAFHLARPPCVSDPLHLAGSPS